MTTERGANSVDPGLTTLVTALRFNGIGADPDQIRHRIGGVPIGICLADDVTPATLAGIAKVAKMMRVTQITIPASPLGTPFNTEVDRLRDFVRLASADGIRLSIKTEVGVPGGAQTPLVMVNASPAVEARVA